MLVWQADKRLESIRAAVSSQAVYINHKFDFVFVCKRAVEEVPASGLGEIPRSEESNQHRTAEHKLVLRNHLCHLHQDSRSTGVGICSGENSLLMHSVDSQALKAWTV